MRDRGSRGPIEEKKMLTSFPRGGYSSVMFTF